MFCSHLPFVSRAAQMLALCQCCNLLLAMGHAYRHIADVAIELVVRHKWSEMIRNGTKTM